LVSFPPPRFLASSADSGFFSDSRRDNEYVASLEKQKNLLVEWQSSFIAQFGSYTEAQEMITKCDVVLKAATEMLNKVQRPLAIQNELS
jgi:hypothetical protein